jgi:hypothetical protein
LLSRIREILQTESNLVGDLFESNLKMERVFRQLNMANAVVTSFCFSKEKTKTQALPKHFT